MGYNNHNCGMHLIRFRHDDWYYNDRLYEEEMSLLRNKTETSRKPVEEKKEEMNTAGQKQGSSASGNEKPKNNKKQSGTSRMTYGTERLISNECLESYAEFCETVKANIMRIAFEKKLDIRGTLKECEKIMVNDSIANSSPNGHGLYYYPKIEHSFLALAVLAEKLGCSVYDLLVNDEIRKKRFAYFLLDKLEELLHKGDAELGKDYYNSYNPVEGENGDVFINVEAFDSLYGLTENTFDFECEDTALRHMDMGLTLNKFRYNDADWYSMDFGISWLNEYTRTQYYSMHAVLWEEATGKLKDFFEDIIKHSPPQKDD